jgi:hypothetical protein
MLGKVQTCSGHPPKPAHAEIYADESIGQVAHSSYRVCNFVLVSHSCCCCCWFPHVLHLLLAAWCWLLLLLLLPVLLPVPLLLLVLLLLPLLLPLPPTVHRHIIFRDETVSLSRCPSSGCRVRCLHMHKLAQCSRRQVGLCRFALAGAQAMLLPHPLQNSGQTLGLRNVVAPALHNQAMHPWASTPTNPRCNDTTRTLPMAGHDTHPQ